MKEPIRITARLEKESRIVSELLPEVGETIYVENLGHAMVESIFHNPLKVDNYIKLQFQETLVGQFSQEFPLTVEKP